MSYEILNNGDSMGVIREKINNNFQQRNSELNDAIGKQMINILHLKLQMALSKADIDAWSEMFQFSSAINASASSGYRFSSGLLQNGQDIKHLADAKISFLGRSGRGRYQKLAQKFTPDNYISVSKISVKVYKNGSPTDGIKMGIYTGTQSTWLQEPLYSSTNTIFGSSLSTNTEGEVCDFYFPNVKLTQGTTYAFVLSRTGSLNNDNYYVVRRGDSNSYSDRAYYYALDNQGTGEKTDWWSYNIFPLYFVVSGESDATIILNPVTATEPLDFFAISSEQVLNSGTITYYVSDDGETWIDIDDLDRLQLVNLSSSLIYLKIVITGNSTVSAIAYGGY